MQFDKSDWLLLAICAVAIFLYFYIRKKFKFPVVGSLSLTTGAVKSGKTTFTLGLAISNYKRIHRRWRIRAFFCKLFKKPIPEEPLFYSNIPVSFPYVQVTTDLIERKKRFRYGSVVFINEASLLASNRDFNNLDLSERVMLFNKLIGHETRGGLLFYDTQAIGDMPAVTRRCLGQYFYVHHITKWIPFFLVAYVQEQRYSEDSSGNAASFATGDIEDGLKRVIIPKSVWKKFDCYCYSVFTDNLPVESKIIILPKGSDLRCTNVVGFREYNSLKQEDLKK